MNKFTEEFKIWLFDLAHGNLSDEETVKGFLKHYALHGLAIDNVAQDMHYHTPYGLNNEKQAMDNLRRCIKDYAN